MITDCAILGIEETEDINLIKAAYRKRIMAVHPDHSSEESKFNNHLLFIQINQAYSRLLKRPKGAAPKTVAPVPQPALAPNCGPSSIVKVKDQAYAFYKTAMVHFMRVHPARWKSDGDPRVAFDENDQEKVKLIKQNVIEIVNNFPKAYYYFSVVAHEYPDSVWAADALAKMTLIEERTKLYKKIIESFGRMGFRETREFRPTIKLN
jgi:hypothetical protein